MCSSVSGTVITAGAAILFALIDPSVTYWAFGFPSTLFIVFGADFVYSAGTIFLAKAANPGEHSVVGALFQTMTQVGVSRHNMLCVKSSHITYYRPRGKKNTLRHHLAIIALPPLLWLATLERNRSALRLA